MADSVSLTLDTRAFLALLRQTEARMHSAMERALEKTSFDVVDALKREGLRAFKNATPRGKQFVGGRGAFQFKLDRPNLVSTITPGENPPKRGSILAEHERGAVIVETPLRLGLANKDLLAVPIGLAANARRRAGRVPAKLAPAALLDPKNKLRGFLAMKGNRGVLLQRRGRGRASYVEPLYAIVERAQLPKVFRWRQTIKEQAEKSLPIKIREQIEKLRAGR